MKKIAAIMLSTLLPLYGCGGWDDDNKSQTAKSTAETVVDAQGIYVGHLNTATALVKMIVLDDGTYWIDYSGLANEMGLIQGHMHISHGAYASQDALDFNFAAAKGSTGRRAAASINGEVIVKQSMDGTISYADGSSANKLRTGFFGNANGYGSWYEQAPDIGRMVGNYKDVNAYVADLHDKHTNVVINADGSLNIELDSCEAQGRLVPRPHGNVFDVTLTFAQSPLNHASCQLADLVGEQITGVAFADSAEQNSFWLMGMNAERTQAMKMHLSHR